MGEDALFHNYWPLLSVLLIVSSVCPPEKGKNLERTHCYMPKKKKTNRPTSNVSTYQVDSSHYTNWLLFKEDIQYSIWPFSTIFNLTKSLSGKPHRHQTLSYFVCSYKCLSDPLGCLSRRSWCRSAAPPTQCPLFAPPPFHCAQLTVQCQHRQRHRWKGCRIGH